MLPEKYQNRLETVFEWLNKHAWGIPSILKRLIEHFNRQRGAEAAASISYYALFSLFPLLLTFASVIGFVLVNEQAQNEAIQLVFEVIPVSQDFIRQNLNEIVNARTSVGIIGFIGLIWAASSVFLTVTRNINRAWPNTNALNVFKGRAIALAIVVGMTLLLLLSGIWSTVSRLLATLNVPIFGATEVYETSAWRFISSFVPWLGTFLILILLYRYVPATRVLWQEAFWGALTATIFWQIINWGLTWYLSSGLVTWELVYGSLSTLIAFMLWIYMSAMAVLIGAHLSSAIAFQRRPGDFPAK